jgi:hypothetical protein
MNRCLPELLPSIPRRLTRLAVPIRILGCAAVLVPSAISSGQDYYTHTNLGTPPGAGITTAVRMNNLGQVVGYSIYYSQGEPAIKPWVWTPENGFTILPPPPDMFLGRARAMDISDTGIIAGDGGFDAGIAWRYENGQYETFGQVEGLPIAYLGAVNDAGDVTGTSKDAQITTEDEVFVDVNGVGTIHLTPGSAGGRGVDINNAGQICGYSQGPLSGFGAFIWDEANGMQFLGTAGLAYSFANDMNDLGQVVGYAQSASGNTINSWIYTPGSGQQVLPTRGAAAINNQGHVVGTITCCGPDEPWLWTPMGGTQMLWELFFYPAVGLSGPSSRDINDAGQILLNAYDNSASGYRPVVLTPIAGGTGACCLAADDCLEGVTEADCTAQGGVYAGNGTQCSVCIPVGACCLTDGNCVPFQTESDCNAVAGFYQGDGTSCSTVSCPEGVANDNCADAAAIELGDTPFSTLGASTDGPALPDSCMEPAGLYFGMDVWYRYEPSGTGTLTVSTCNQANYDTRLAAYTGACGSLEIADCNLNGPGCIPHGSFMEFAVSCNEPILIRLGSYSVYTGTGTLTLTFTGDPCAASCAGDTNGDQVVDVDDLTNIILAWGTADPSADVTLDGQVDVDDLTAVILGWGPCL